MFARLLCLAVYVVALSTQGAGAVDAGYTLERLRDETRDRPLLIDWWYPVAAGAATDYNYGLGRGRVAEAAEIPDGLRPLVILSHGAMGSARNYSWLAEHLARGGFLVAGVSHFGESYVYGPESVDPSAVVRWWERPEDVRVLLDLLAAGKSRFSVHVDWQRVGFAGHSSGGATALMLAGLHVSSPRLADYCATDAALADRGCDYGRDSGAEKETLKLGSGATAMQPSATAGPESRIHRFVALDPALGPGFENFSGLPKQQALLLVGSVQNDFLPIAFHAEHIASKLPGAPTVWLNDGEGHFVYLNDCGLPEVSGLAANGVPLCTDRPGVVRAEVHRRLAARILQHFNSERTAGSDGAGSL